jgi:hypothetical protein
VRAAPAGAAASSENAVSAAKGMKRDMGEA